MTDLSTWLLGGLLLVAALIAVSFRRLRALLRALVAAAGPVPPRLTLQPDDDPRPPVPRRFHATVEEVRAAGLRSVGRFRVPALGDLRVHAFVADDHVAVVYAHPIAGVWVDVAEAGADGVERTVTNMPPQPHDVRPPWRHLVERPGASVRAILDEFGANRLPPPREPVGDFRERFERAWAREMDWRNARGGPTLAELRARGTKHSDAVLEATRRQLHGHALANLEVPFREQLAALGFPDGAYVFVHDALEAEDLAALLPEGVPDGSPRDAFRAAVEGRPEADRPRFVVHLAHPLPTDVWAPARAENGAA